jgi:hypothetical protein
MSATKYTYSIQSDFPNHIVATDRLAQEIRASAIITALDGINTSGDVCDIWFKGSLSQGDETILAGLVAAHQGQPLPENTTTLISTGKNTSDGSPIFAYKKPDAPKLTFITSNWCDRTTWYSSSVYVEDEVATDSGDHTTYNLAHPDVIDTYHGKISFEDFLKDSQGRSYRVAVKVDDVAKVERDPHVGSGGDFTVNYADGKIVFLSALQGTEVVKVTHHYANGSTFVVAPITGKVLMIETVEVQCSDDLEMLDTFVFQAYGLVDVFAPQLMQPPYNIPSGTKIPLGDPLKYKTIQDIINDSNHSYPAYPALGGVGWRGTQKPSWIFAWDYDVGSTMLRSSWGMEIRISLEHDTKCGGTYATATLYCTSENES